MDFFSQKLISDLECRFLKMTAAGSYLHLIGVQILKEKKEKVEDSEMQHFFLFLLQYLHSDQV